MPRPRPPHLQRETTRHGAVVWYVRKDRGPRIRLRSPFGSSKFWAEYAAALEGAPPKAGKAPGRGTLAFYLDLYRTSSAWSKLAPSTRRARENIFEKVIATAGTESIRAIDAKAIRDGRERRAATPHSANVFVKAMRAFFAFLLDEGIVADDPTRGISLLRGENDDVGFHTWTEDEVEKFESHWSIGTQERLALDILLYTGLRRGDAVRIGKQHIRNGILSIRTEKNGIEVTLPILPPLANSIARTKTGDLALLIHSGGRPWAKESFGNWFRDACRAAAVPGSAHGLRKAGATRAAENGATEHQLMAIFGWAKPKTAEIYTRAANRKRMALGAASLLIIEPAENEILPHPLPGAGIDAKNKARSGT